MAGDEFTDDVSAECHGRGDRGMYLADQTRKVGWKPIFALLEHEICGSPCAPAILEDFKATVCFAVGIQNDIRRFQRDMQGLDNSGSIGGAGWNCLLGWSE